MHRSASQGAARPLVGDVSGRAGRGSFAECTAQQGSTRRQMGGDREMQWIAISTCWGCATRTTAITAIKGREEGEEGRGWKGWEVECEAAGRPGVGSTR